MKVYLAGSTAKSKLRDAILTVLAQGGHECVDPATHGLLEEKSYTAWDLAGIDSADIVVAFMDPSNPSGYGMSLEIGYAKGTAKPVFFIDMLGTDWRSKYFGMVRAVSAATVRNVEDLGALLWRT